MTTGTASSPTEPVPGRPYLGRGLGAAVAVALIVVVLTSGAAGAALEIAITVDDLPSHGPLPPGDSRLAIATRMIEGFRRHAVPGVYGFLNGAQLRDNPDLEAVVRAWRQAGLGLGNHTFSHLDLARVSAEEFLADVERNEPLLVRWSPGAPWKYFRYPYLHEGDTSGKGATVRSALLRRGYRLAPVTVSFKDWLWNDAYGRCLARGDGASIARLKATFLEAARARLTAARDLAARLFRRPIKHVVLLHIGAFDALMLEALLRDYRAAGVTFVALPAALGDPIYQLNPPLAEEGDRTFLERFTPAIPPGDPLASREVVALCP